MNLEDVQLDKSEGIDHGHNSTIYIIRDDDQRLVVKKYADTVTLRKEKTVLEHLATERLNMTTPTVYDHDLADNTVLMSYIPGTPPSKPCPEDIWTQYAQGKQALNTIKFEAYGDLDNNFNVAKPYDTAQAYYEDEMKKFFETLNDNQVISQALLNSIQTVWRKASRTLRYDKGPVFIQGDPSLDNYLYKNEALQGVVDFEHSRAGNILEDIYQTRDEFPARLDKLDLFVTTLLDEPPQHKHKQLARTYHLIAQVRMLYLIPRMSWEESVDHQKRKKNRSHGHRKNQKPTFSL